MDKNTKQIVTGVTFIVLTIAGFFAYDYYETQRLLSEGLRSNAVIIGKYYEYNTNNKDTSTYMMRYQVVDEKIKLGDREASTYVLNGFVKERSYKKYNEGDTVALVFFADDLDHVKLLEEVK